MNNQNTDTLIHQLHDLSSDKPDNQFKAAIELGNIAGANAQTSTMLVDELIKAMSSEHQALTRAHASEALGKLKDPKAVTALIKALKDDYQLVRSYAARALGKLGDPKAIESLLHVLRNDPFFGARAEAAEALGVLCQDNDTPSGKKGREELVEYRKEEEKKKSEEERSKRVLREIDDALKELGVIIDKAVNTTDNALQNIRKVQLELSQLQKHELEQKLKNMEQQFGNLKQELEKARKKLKEKPLF